jgi:hypothetical protein
MNKATTTDMIKEVMASQLGPGQTFKLSRGTKRIETMRNYQGNGYIVAVSSKGKPYLLGSHVPVFVRSRN